MIFLTTEEDGSYRLRSHPGWLIGDTPGVSRPLTNEELIDHGFGLEVIYSPPSVGPYEVAQLNPIEDWVLSERTATATYTVVPKPFEPLTPVQIRMGLLELGITETQIDALLESDQDGFVKWKFASRYHRDHPLVAALMPAFSLTDVQVDSLWRWAEDFVT